MTSIDARAHAQDIVKEAVKGIIILAILERLFLTRPVSWLEARCAHDAPPLVPRSQTRSLTRIIILVRSTSIT